MNRNTLVKELWAAQKELGENDIFRGKSATIQMPTGSGKTKSIGIRASVEYAMQKGLIRFIICTSTLAQGVNLPIRYLIISSAYQGGNRIKTRDFQNLIGRAGRAGMYTEGTIIISETDVYKWRKGQTPEIYVGETEYDLIDVANIEIIGCSSAKNPANFIFTDGKHEYKYTSADSQLYMKFNNKGIVLDTWNVKYAEDAYGLFSDIADKIYGIKKDTNVGRDNIRESYAWKIEVHRYSGFNGFFGVGSKMGTDAREGKINKVESKHQESVDKKLLSETKNMLQTYFLTKAINNDDRKQKERLRNSIIEIVRKGNNNGS